LTNGHWRPILQSPFNFVAQLWMSHAPAEDVRFSPRKRRQRRRGHRVAAVAHEARVVAHVEAQRRERLKCQSSRILQKNPLQYQVITDISW